MHAIIINNPITFRGLNIPLLELSCSECGAYFELGIEIKVKEVICVNCGYPQVDILRKDEELSTRINNLVIAVQDIAQRIDILEGEVFDESGSNATKDKSKKVLN